MPAYSGVFGGGGAFRNRPLPLWACVSGKVSGDKAERGAGFRDVFDFDDSGAGNGRGSGAASGVVGAKTGVEESSNLGADGILCVSVERTDTVPFFEA